jgi:PIN domain nuclease of toxin-antitoxin system
MIYVADTHALTRYVEGDRRLGAAAHDIFNDPQSLLIVSTIALAEARHMIFRGKTKLIWSDILRALDTDDRLLPFGLTVDVVDRIPENLEMHDGIIVATATLLREVSDEGVRVITRDNDIRNSGLVETVW